MDTLVTSHIILWVIVIIQSLLIFALMRQIGVLHERVFPAGALMTTAGPKVGEPAPQHTLHSLSGAAITIGGKAVDGYSTLLLFVSPACPICKTLLPLVKSVIAAEKKAVRIILASDADTDNEKTQHLHFIREQQLPADHYVLSRTLGLAFLVDKLPFAALIDEHGILRAKGMVNSREHLESLFEAQARGVASLQEYLTRSAA